MPQNRVHAAIERTRAKTPTIDPAKLAGLDKTLAIDASEHFAFQEAQSIAHAEGLLTPEEAQIVYVALGEVGSSTNGGWAQGTDLETKVIVTQIIGELLSARVRGAKLKRAA